MAGKCVLRTLWPIFMSFDLFFFTIRTLVTDHSWNFNRIYLIWHNCYRSWPDISTFFQQFQFLQFEFGTIAMEINLNGSRNIIDSFKLLLSANINNNWQYIKPIIIECIGTQVNAVSGLRMLSIRLIMWSLKSPLETNISRW